MSTSKPRICVDFDGVLNTYTGWAGPENLFEPRDGALDFVKELSKNFNVVIFSTRDPQLLMNWMEKNGFTDFIVDITNEKVPAMVYIDDRAYYFNGDYSQALSDISEHSKKYPWYQRTKTKEKA